MLGSTFFNLHTQSFLQSCIMLSYAHQSFKNQFETKKLASIAGIAAGNSCTFQLATLFNTTSRLLNSTRSATKKERQKHDKSKQKGYCAGNASSVIRQVESLHPKFLAKFILQQARIEPAVLKPSDLARISQQLKLHSSQLSYRDVFRIAEACYLISFVDFDLLKCLSVRVINELQSLQASECSRLAFAFARLGAFYAPLYTALSIRYASLISAACPADLTRIAIAYGCLALKDEQLFSKTQRFIKLIFRITNLASRIFLFLSFVTQTT